MQNTALLPHPSSSLPAMRRVLGAAVVLLAAFALPAGASAKTDAAGAKSFVRDLGNRAISFLKARDGLSPEESSQRFRALLIENFDMATISRFVLGRYWRRATEAQRREYQALFTDFVVRVYGAKLGEYAGQSFDVVRTRAVSDGDQIVGVEVQSPDVKGPIHLDLRVRKQQGRYTVVDVIAEGISMLVTQRDEFASVVRRRGIEGLLAGLRAQVSGAQQPRTEQASTE